MHAASGLFSWSMELLAFAGRLFAPKMLDHLLTTSVCHSNPSLLVSERGGRNHPLREAPCTSILVPPGIHLVYSSTTACCLSYWCSQVVYTYRRITRAYIK